MMPTVVNDNRFPVGSDDAALAADALRQMPCVPGAPDVNREDEQFTDAFTPNEADEEEATEDDMDAILFLLAPVIIFLTHLINAVFLFADRAFRFLASPGFGAGVAVFVTAALVQGFLPRPFAWYILGTGIGLSLAATVELNRYLAKQEEATPAPALENAALSTVEGETAHV